MTPTLVAAAALATGPGFAGPPPDLDFLLCHATRELQRAEDRSRQFEYHKDDVEMKTQGVEVVERKTVTRFVHRTRPGGVAVNEIVERNGRPVDADERAEQQAKVRARLEEIGNDAGQLVEYLAKSREKRDTIGAIARAFELELLGLDWIGDEPCWVTFFRPRPGFQPRTKTEEYLEKFQGVAWVRVREPAMLRVEADFIDSMSAKWGPLAKIKKGSYMKFEAFEVEPGVTLSRSLELDLKLRIFFVVPKRMTRGTYYREHERALPAGVEMIP